MSMFVSRSLDYAVRCLIELAANPDTQISLRELAERSRVPRSYLAKVMRTLVVANLARSDAGVRGGYTLTRAPAEISLREIYESVEGSFRTVICGDDGNGDCALRDDCAQVPVWRSLQEEIQQILGRRTLADFVVPAHPPASLVPLERVRAQG
jgi:Rrf2 family protein